MVISVYTYAVIFLALVDYYVTLFRGKAFMLMDVMNVGTAAEVTGNYVFTISVKIGICLLAALLLLSYLAVSLLFCGKRRKMGRNICLESQFL